jgi:hypothetical protein
MRPSMQRLLYQASGTNAYGAGGTSERKIDHRARAGAAAPTSKEPLVPDYYAIPLFLVVLSLALVGVIYWGGFVEERRNGRTG